MNAGGDGPSHDAPRRAGFWPTMRAVLWSFFGVRKRQAYLDDAGSLNPLAVVAAGVLAGALFVIVIAVAVQVVLA
ncbi:DUF2970 domain-containing protein [Thauera linaloolentis]|uniref:DUF2970 domain-containing protein n=1 Tax=Thauera linaloolentis (strain DSM 12138 / JCM 21573 / CCUG 41526 / CIP 105981 / IAM 15112 / NBRC 102519 / 47Lol) TaxID=1123367 RepID=N6YVI1_THAL4|nr:DUF2970 domain-containing protein [Thauera linaloolentis]ENO86402.1 hypothetical protein C666_13300 [Thauera linaloolentis 47Lol = DSM 12138]MCM8564215.1 DUF2970 domain-containing protein [Thauera linaloolentis]